MTLLYTFSALDTVDQHLAKVISVKAYGVTTCDIICCNYFSVTLIRFDNSN